MALRLAITNGWVPYGDGTRAVLLSRAVAYDSATFPASEPTLAAYFVDDVTTAAAHASTHAAGQSDAITPSAIGAETPSGAAVQIATHAALVDPHGSAHTALRTWYAALANRSYAPARIATLGGSTTEGQGSTVWGRHLCARLATRLREAYPTTNVAGGAGLVCPVTFTSGQTGYPAALSNGAAANVTYGGWATRSAVVQTGGSPGAMSVTYTFASLTEFEVIYSRYTGFGHFTYQIDSGGTVDVDCATGGATNRFASTGIISAGSRGAHTITITWASGNACYIRGVMAYDQDSASGIQMWEGGRSGFTSTQYAGMADLGAAITVIQPHLVVIDLGRNDFGATPQISPATMTTNIQAIISTVRGACATTPSILLYVTQQLGGAVSGTPWADYRAAYAAIAAADTGVCICDLSTRQVSPLTSNALGLYATDITHLTDKGHTAVADVYGRFLSPR